jgi:hypothetical protein
VDRKEARRLFMKREHRFPSKSEIDKELESMPQDSIVSDSLKAAEENLQAVEKEAETLKEEPEKLTWTDEKPSDMPVAPIGEPIEGPPTPSNAPNFITEVVAMFHDLACTALNCRCFEFTDKLRASWNRIVSQFGPTDLKKFEKYLPYLGIVGLAATYIFMFKAHADHTKGQKPPQEAKVPTSKAPSEPKIVLGRPRGTMVVPGVSTEQGIGRPRNTIV